MNPMKAKEFLTLQKRDLDNGAVREAIYVALKERETLIKQLGEPTVASLIKQNKILHKELKLLEEAAFREEIGMKGGYNEIEVDEKGMPK